jgi:hypothetical protein
LSPRREVRSLPSSSSASSSRSRSERTPTFVCELPLRVSPGEGVHPERPPGGGAHGVQRLLGQGIPGRAPSAGTADIPGGAVSALGRRADRRLQGGPPAATSGYRPPGCTRSAEAGLPCVCRPAPGSLVSAAAPGSKNTARWTRWRASPTTRASAGAVIMSNGSDSACQPSSTPLNPVITHALGCRMKYGRVVGEGEVGLDVGPPPSRWSERMSPSWRCSARS